MGTLSSCYFCGSALDVSLSEYPVVPKQFRIEDQDSTTVVLCDPCREKLATIIEEVVDAAAVADTDTAAERTDSVIELAEKVSDETAAPASDTATPDTPEQTGDEGIPTEDPAEATADETADQSTTAGIADRAGDNATDGPSTGDATATDDGPSLSRLEYNKVMRLLQNRQLPVDRAEIRDVAVSAYGIDPSEFDAIVEAATERGLIAERNGQFVDPE